MSHEALSGTCVCVCIQRPTRPETTGALGDLVQSFVAACKPADVVVLRNAAAAAGVIPEVFSQVSSICMPVTYQHATGANPRVTHTSNMMAISPHSGRLTLIMGSADTGTLCTVGSAASAVSYKHVTLPGTETIVQVPASGSYDTVRACKG